MKNIFKMIIISTISCFIFWGCSNSTEKIDSTKINVYTSFYPMYDFASKIGGDKINLVNIISSGEEAHDWEPTPQDIINLENADMFIYSGAGMEHWVESVLTTIKNKDLVILEASSGIKLLDAIEPENEDEEHEEESQFDPHVWLSIKNAKIQLENIKNSLCELDPENKDFYESNYTKYALEFDTLDNKFSTSISALDNKTIIVSHQAFAYLVNDYGLTQKSIQGISPDSEPTPAKIAEVIDFVKENNVKVIFFEQLASPKVSEIIAKETGAKTDMLSTVESLTSEQYDNNEDYLSIMSKNLDAIINALK